MKLFDVISDRFSDHMELAAWLASAQMMFSSFWDDGQRMVESMMQQDVIQQALDAAGEWHAMTDQAHDAMMDHPDDFTGGGMGMC